MQLFDLHGYMRMRGDYFHRLNLGIDDFDSNDEPLPNKFFRPPAETGEYREEAGRTTFVANDADCFARLTQAGVSLQRATTRCQRRNGIPSANLHLRLEPTLHITDTVKVHSQVDLLDNVVLGSTPDTFLYDNPNAPIDLYTRSQVPPSSGVNSFDDSIVVKRAWGHVRFGFGLDFTLFIGLDPAAQFAAGRAGVFLDHQPPALDQVEADQARSATIIGGVGRILVCRLNRRGARHFAH